MQEHRGPHHDDSAHDETHNETQDDLGNGNDPDQNEDDHYEVANTRVHDDFEQSRPDFHGTPDNLGVFLVHVPKELDKNGEGSDEATTSPMQAMAAVWKELPSKSAGDFLVVEEIEGYALHLVVKLDVVGIVVVHGSKNGDVDVDVWVFHCDEEVPGSYDTSDCEDNAVLGSAQGAGRGRDLEDQMDS